MATLKLPNGVSLTYPKSWVIKERFGSQPGQDWNIILQNQASTLHVWQQTIGGLTSKSSKKDGSNHHSDVALIKDSFGRISKSRI